MDVPGNKAYLIIMVCTCTYRSSPFPGIRTSFPCSPQKSKVIAIVGNYWPLCRTCHSTCARLDHRGSPRKRLMQVGRWEVRLWGSDHVIVSNSHNRHHTLFQPLCKLHHLHTVYIGYKYRSFWRLGIPTHVTIMFGLQLVRLYIWRVTI